MLEDVGIEVLTTKMGVTSGGLDSEDTALNVEEGDIESTTTQIVDQNVTLLGSLPGAQSVGNSGRRRLVNDTKDIKTGDSTGILGSLALVVIEVSRNSDDGLLNLLSKLGFGNFFHLPMRVSLPAQCRPFDNSHLHEDHGRDLLRGEGLGLAEVVNLDSGVTALVNDLEGPRLGVLLDGRVIITAADETPCAVKTDTSGLWKPTLT